MKLKIDQDRQVGWIETKSGEWTIPIRQQLRDLGCRWRPKPLSRWQFPLSLEVAEKLIMLLRNQAVDYGQGSIQDLEPMSDDFFIWRNQETARKGFLSAYRSHPNRGNYSAWPSELLKFDSKTEPYAHQPYGAWWLYQSERAHLLDKPGLGKTYQAIVAAKALNAHQVVIICPNSIKYVWEEEIHKHAPGKNELFIPAGSTAARLRQLTDLAGGNLVDGVTAWIILNYESLRYFCEMTQDKRGRIMSIDTGILGKLCEGTIVICDEVSHCKNGQAKQTKIVKALRPKHLWGLTGTAITNKLEDVWSIVDLVKPGLLGWSWWEFEREHIKRGKYNEIAGYMNVERIQKALASVSFGRTKEQCLDLPEKIFEVRHVELASDERKPYEQMKKDLIAWIEHEIAGKPTVAQATTFATRFMRLRQLTHGMVSEGVGKSLDWAKSLTKIKEAVQIWKDFDRERIIIWYRFRPVGERTYEEFSDLKDAMVWEINGSVPIELRRAMVDLWSKAKGGILIAQMDVGGEGLNLQAGHYQVFLDLPTTPGQREQTVDRQHRIGQRHDVVVVDIVARNTVDAACMKMLRDKTEWATEATAPAFGMNVSKWKEAIGG